LTIPTASNAEEGRKVGLVTAGGASILGKGIDRRGGEEIKQEGGTREESDDDEDSQVSESPFYFDVTRN